MIAKPIYEKACQFLHTLDTPGNRKASVAISGVVGLVLIAMAAQGALGPLATPGFIGGLSLELLAAILLGLPKVQAASTSKGLPESSPHPMLLPTGKEEMSPNEEQLDADTICQLAKEYGEQAVKNLSLGDFEAIRIQMGLDSMSQRHATLNHHQFIYDGLKKNGQEEEMMEALERLIQVFYYVRMKSRGKAEVKNKITKAIKRYYRESQQFIGDEVFQRRCKILFESLYAHIFDEKQKDDKIELLMIESF